MKSFKWQYEKEKKNVKLWKVKLLHELQKKGGKMKNSFWQGAPLSPPPLSRYPLPPSLPPQATQRMQVQGRWGRRGNRGHQVKGPRATPDRSPPHSCPTRHSLPSWAPAAVTSRPECLPRGPGLGNICCKNGGENNGGGNARNDNNSSTVVRIMLKMIITKGWCRNNDNTRNDND